MAPDPLPGKYIASILASRGTVFRDEIDGQPAVLVPGAGIGSGVGQHSHDIRSAVPPNAPASDYNSAV